MTDLTMVVPNLASLAELATRDSLRWPAVNQVIARGDILRSDGQPGDGFARALGLHNGLGGLARYSYLFDVGADPEGGCARLDPVELGVGPRGLFLSSASLKDLQRQEADALVRELEPMMQEFGWRLEAPVPARWYMITEEPLGPGLGPPALAEGESLMLRLAGNEAGRQWATLLNEIQVILHQHPVNLQREKDGRPRANCLWPWGGGAGKILDGARVPELFSDGDPILGGLARAVGAPVGPASGLADIGMSWFGSKLVSLDASGSVEQRLDDLESRWLGPLCARPVPPRRLVLSDLDGWGYRMGWLNWWYRWRKPKRGGDGE
jgi:hypothetical protein